MTTETLPMPSLLTKPGLARPSFTATAIVACTLLALALRAFMAAWSGIWSDEAQFLWIVRMPSSRAMIRFLGCRESHPPLFYLLMRAWLGVFGDSAAAALVLPVGLGAALIPLAYHVGARMFCRRTGLVAAVLVTLAPMLAWHAAQVRPYSLMPLLCLASVYLLWRGMSVGGARSWAMYAVVTMALLLTHNWAWLVLSGQWTMVGTWLAMHRSRSAGPLIRQWLLVQAALLAAYAPWIPILLYQARHAGHGPQAVAPLEGLGFFVETVTSLPRLAVVALLTLIFIAARRAARQPTTKSPGDDPRRLAIHLLIGIPLVAGVAAIILSAKTYLFWPRCLITVAPCVLVAMARGVDLLLSSSRSSLFLVTLGALAASHLIGSAALLGQVKSNAREVAAAVASRARPSDLVLIAPPWIASSFNYYYPGDNPQIDYPFEGRTGAISYGNLKDRLVDPEPMALIKEQLAQVHRQGRRVWLVTERDRPSDQAPEDNTLPKMDRNLPYSQIGKIRSHQIRQAMDALYGAPRTDAAPGEGGGGVEILRVSLYEASSPVVAGPSESDAASPEHRVITSRPHDHFSGLRPIRRGGTLHRG